MRVSISAIDVRKRRHVVQCIAPFVQVIGELPVGNAARHGDATQARIEVDAGLNVPERNQRAVGIGDIVECVACANDSDVRARCEDILDVLYSSRIDYALRTIRVVT